MIGITIHVQWYVTKHHSQTWPKVKEDGHICKLGNFSCLSLWFTVSAESVVHDHKAEQIRNLNFGVLANQYDCVLLPLQVTGSWMCALMSLHHRNRCYAAILRGETDSCNVLAQQTPFASNYPASIIPFLYNCHWIMKLSLTACSALRSL